MAGSLLIGLVLVSGLMALFAAIGVKLLRDFAGHELEEYCEQRGDELRLTAILQEHEAVMARAEALQLVAMAVLLICGATWVAGRFWSASVLWYDLLLLIAAGALALLILTSWLPAAVVRIWSVPLLYHTWPVWKAINALFIPLDIGARAMDGLLGRVADKPKEASNEEDAFEDELLTMVAAGERGGLLQERAREMIEGVFELSDRDVADIMTPRCAVDAIDVACSWEQIIEFVVNVRRTRIPVYEGSLDNVLGVLYVKDLLAEMARASGGPRRTLRQILRPPWFVPTTKRLDAMLREFLHTRSHLAIVRDEFGRMAGVVTIEDVLEEIVGEIVDESDQEADREIEVQDDAKVAVLGTARVEELNERFHIDLPEADEYDTVAGFVLTKLGRIPKEGEAVVHNNVRLVVTEANGRRIERLQLQWLEGANGKSSLAPRPAADSSR